MLRKEFRRTCASTGLPRQIRDSSFYRVKLLPVITRVLQFSLLMGIVAQVHGQTVAHPDVPDKIKAPAGENIVLLAHASGSQIYVCQPGTDGKLAWTLKAPDAELHDQQG